MLAPGPVQMGAENLAPTGIRSLDHPARNELLYRLHYPSPQTACINTKHSAFHPHSVLPPNIILTGNGIFALHSIFWLVFLMETESVYCETGADFMWRCPLLPCVPPPVMTLSPTYSPHKVAKDNNGCDQVALGSSHRKSSNLPPPPILLPNPNPDETSVLVSYSLVYSHRVSLSQTQ